MKTLKNTDNGGVQKKTSAVAETPSKKDNKKKDNKKDLPKPAPSSTVVIKAAPLAQKKRKKDTTEGLGSSSAGEPLGVSGRETMINVHRAARLVERGAPTLHDC